MSNEFVWYQSIAVVLCVALPVVPIVAFLLTGWKAKRNDITDGVSLKAKQCYLMMFALSNYASSPAPTLPADAASAAIRCEKVFADFYTRWYGRRHYVLPVLVFVAVLAGLAVYLAGSSPALNTPRRSRPCAT